MKVLITGATGFVGSHIAAALANAGHGVRVLARTPSKVEGTLAVHGVPAVDVVGGDVTDTNSVDRALAGCDGLVHAANIYTLDPRRGEEMSRVNVAGTDIVLAAGRRHGCDPIIHVSTMLTLLPAEGQVAPDLPVGSGSGRAYTTTKIGAEHIARRHQEEGAPVVTTYPGGVYGPHDPVPGEMIHVLNFYLGNRFRIRFPQRCGFPLVDVRWLADAHVALCEPGRGPRKVPLAGRYVGMDEMFAALRRLTGRKLRATVPTTRRMALASGRAADGLQRMLPVRMPFSYEGSWILFNGAPVDDTLGHALAGPLPAVDDTLRDAIRWGVEAGHIRPRHAGDLA